MLKSWGKLPSELGLGTVTGGENLGLEMEIGLGRVGVGMNCGWSYCRGELVLGLGEVGLGSKLR